MALTLMYITNKPDVAKIAQKSGVDRIFVDMEYIGKDERQKGMDTVKSHHTYIDVENISHAIKGGASKLQVRINPIHDATSDYCSSEEEIDTVIACGADIIMLPMFKTSHEVERFLNAVNGRAKTLLLLETREADQAINEILSVGGYDEIHVGINDLHLAYNKKFMFELYIDGTLDRLSRIFNENNIRFGIGGIARVGYGMLPAEYIIAEHYRLGSKMAILSRSFCDANKSTNMQELEEVFTIGVHNIRQFEKKAQLFSQVDFEDNHKMVESLIAEIIKNK